MLRTSETIMCKNYSQHPLPMDWLCLFEQKCPFRYCFCGGAGRVAVCPVCLMWTHECPLCPQTLKESGRTALEFDHISRHMKNRHPGYNRTVVPPLREPHPSSRETSASPYPVRPRSPRNDSHTRRPKRVKIGLASPGYEVCEE